MDHRHERMHLCTSIESKEYLRDCYLQNIQVGLKFPTVEVRYNKLHVEAECEVVSGKPLPTLWNSLQRMIFDIAKIGGLKSRKAKISIINEVSGIIKPGRMTLLLGPPGCGKTSFLKSLSGNPDKSLKRNICWDVFAMGLCTCTAVILQSTFNTVFNLFSGFVIPQPQIPKWWLWLYYLTPLSWTLNIMLSSQYGDVEKEINHFGFHHDRLPMVGVVMMLYPIIFAIIFAYCIGKLNFQRR
nr:PREDICTED: pleiotropic drug resistance protein 3-like isoform X2 [Daucus carota subsp. sativus]